MNMDIIKSGAKGMSNHEKANLKRAMSELMFIALCFLAYSSYEDDDDEIIKKYMFRRTLAELSFFSNPFDAYKIVSTPTASIGTMRNILNLFIQMFDPFEEYEQGSNKGRTKLNVSLMKVMPIFAQIKTKDKFQDALKYLQSGGGF